MKMKQKLDNIKYDVIAITLFIVLAFIANWSLLLGTNLMKWDIWDCHYPIQVIVSDAINSGTFPIWLPLYDYGTPYYATVGNPVWYPITILLDIIGYSPICTAIEYVAHIVIGAVGMYFLTKNVLVTNDANQRKTDMGIAIIAIVIGIFYEFSGIFLSNAEHIMIVISVAWIPWGLLLAKEYTEKHKSVYGMSAGVCAAMMFLGGYPEIFYNFFLILLIWVLYFSAKYKKNDKKYGFILEGLGKYFIVIICTVLASAISLIPFLRIIPLITRGGGQNPLTYPRTSLLSFLLPVTVDSISNSEISMGLFYFGFMPVFTLFLLLKHKAREINHFLFWMFLFTLCLSLGNTSWMHAILYRFAPMYSSFRFPTLWRGFVTIFALLIAAEMLFRVFVIGESEKETLLSVLKKAIIITIPLLGISYILSVVGLNETTISISDKLCDGFILLFAFEFLYIFLIYSIDYWNNKNRKKIVYLSLIATVSLEVLAVQHKAFPKMIASYGPTEYYYSTEAMEKVNGAFGEYKNRNEECSFIYSSRTDSGLDSRKIAFGKNLDEDGYLSVKLANTASYKETVNNNIIKTNPVIYFTNNIVDEKDISLVNWSNQTDIPSDQIHIEDIDTVFTHIGELKDDSVSNTVEITGFTFNSLSFNVDAASSGIVNVLQSNYDGWNLYIDGKKQNIVETNGCFIGVPITAGRHEVLLKFRPIDFVIGLCISALYFLFWIVMIVRNNKDKGNKELVIND